MENNFLPIYTYLGSEIYLLKDQEQFDNFVENWRNDINNTLRDSVIYNTKKSIYPFKCFLSHKTIRLMLNMEYATINYGGAVKGVTLSLGTTDKTSINKDTLRLIVHAANNVNMIPQSNSYFYYIYKVNNLVPVEKLEYNDTNKAKVSTLLNNFIHNWHGLDVLLNYLTVEFLVPGSTLCAAINASPLDINGAPVQNSVWMPAIFQYTKRGLTIIQDRLTLAGKNDGQTKFVATPPCPPECYV